MEQVRSSDGTRIAFERFGGGAPVVLVGGALCDAASNRPLAEELGRLGLAGVTYDRRGRGASDAGDPYAVERETEDLAALIEHLGEPTALYGHSSGAGLALRAVADGVPVTGLVLHEAPYNLDEPDAVAVSRAYRDELDAAIAADRPEQAVKLFLRTVGLPEDQIAGMRAEPWWPAMVRLGPTLVHDSEAMGDRDGGTVPAELLPRVTAPTLVLYGDASPPWMLTVAEQLVAGLPDARLTVLEGEEHVVAPEVLAPVLKAFLT